MACTCPESREPIKQPEGINYPGRLWRVLRRNTSYSAFNGYRPKWSATSLVGCLRCGETWATKAEYVGSLEDVEDERWPMFPLGPSYENYNAEMERFGRTVSAAH